MDDAKNQLADKLKKANNVLVSVSRDPSVDQLAACLGLTLLLNKLGKHAAAVFSGAVPSTIEFLQPEDTLEKNTDSLRDFIIALDKNKADKLRYKVEDNVVRIFITPYKTSISQEDLEFSQGDFNVDVVVALGVKQQEDLDEAITAHGRILHDATVASINTAPDGGLGTINWHDPQASSLSELVTELAQTLSDKPFDNQIATALLTGIVAETDRFSNDKTSSQTMSASAALMAAGANQQLVATKLESEAGPDGSGGPSDEGDGGKPVSKNGDDSPKLDDGALNIKHDDGKKASEPGKAGDGGQPPDSGQSATSADVATQTDKSEPVFELPTPKLTTEAGTQSDQIKPAANSNLSAGSKLVTEPPVLGGVLTANSSTPVLDPVTDPLSLPSTEPPQLLSRPAQPQSPPPPPVFEQPNTSTPSLTPAPSTWTPAAPAEPSSPPPAGGGAGDDNSHTLSELEASVNSPHLDSVGLDAARDEVSKALSSSPNTTTPEPIQALNAQPLSGDLHPSGLPAGASTTPASPSPVTAPTTQVTDPTAPPPVPPPIPFQFGAPSNPPSN